MVPFCFGQLALAQVFQLLCAGGHFALAVALLVLGAVHLAGLTRVQVPSPLTLNSSTGRGPRATWQEDEGRRRPCALSMGSVGPALYRRA